MGLRADSARSQRVSGSARTDSQRAESALNPIAANVKFGDDSALSAFTRTQWTAALKSEASAAALRPAVSRVGAAAERRGRAGLICQSPTRIF